MWQRNINLAFLVICFLVIGQQVPQTQAADVLQCLQCDSGTDPNCITDVSKIAAKACDDDTYKFCTTSVDKTSGKVTRACAKDTTSCTATDPNCQSCDAPSCNKHNVCKTCDSSTDADCAQTDGAKVTFNSICAAADTQCLTNVKADKHLERKCATAADITACTTDTCSKCSTANCNVAVFPAKRVRCYQCASTDSKCANIAANSDTIVSKPCRLYAADDKCYTFGTSGTSMTRGCVSDTDTNVNKCSSPDSNEACATCVADHCNNRDYEYAQKLKCVQCTSSKDDTKCAWGHEVTNAKDCQKKIAYNKPEQCYTQTKDGTVYRGCFYDRDATALGECASGSGCETCTSGDGCNNKDTAFSCIICRSDLETKCREKAGELQGSSCRNTVTADTSGCYYGSWNGIAIRGCLVDGDIQQQALCNDAKNKQCLTCKEKDCNKDKINGASTMTVATGLMVGVLFALWRLH